MITPLQGFVIRIRCQQISGFGTGFAIYPGDMAPTWEDSLDGVLTLPSGRRVRGRGLRDPMPTGPPPEFGLYLLGHPPPAVAWPGRWLRWRDFWLPADRAAAAEALREVWQRVDSERVEVACLGGQGRTGTALAVLAVIDGVPAERAVDFVRAGYRPGAVEMPWQRRYVTRFR